MIQTRINIRQEKNTEEVGIGSHYREMEIEELTVQSLNLTHEIIKLVSYRFHNKFIVNKSGWPILLIICMLFKSEY